MLRYQSEGEESKCSDQILLDRSDLLMEGSAAPRKTDAPLAAPGRFSRRKEEISSGVDKR
jgi:hypothetical protein